MFNYSWYNKDMLNILESNTIGNNNLFTIFGILLSKQRKFPLHSFRDNNSISVVWLLKLEYGEDYEIETKNKFYFDGPEMRDVTEFWHQVLQELDNPYLSINEDKYTNNVEIIFSVECLKKLKSDLKNYLQKYLASDDFFYVHWKCNYARKEVLNFISSKFEELDGKYKIKELIINRYEISEDPNFLFLETMCALSGLKIISITEMISPTEIKIDVINSKVIREIIKDKIIEKRLSIKNTKKVSKISGAVFYVIGGTVCHHLNGSIKSSNIKQDAEISYYNLLKKLVSKFPNGCEKQPIGLIFGRKVTTKQLQNTLGSNTTGLWRAIKRKNEIISGSNENIIHISNSGKISFNNRIPN